MQFLKLLKSVSAILIVGSTLAGCSNQQALEAESSTYVALEQDHFVIRGPIDMDATRKLTALFESNSSIRTLAISSDGGDPMAAMQLGYLLHRNQFTLEVEDYCLNSCANYVFTAAYERKLTADAIVAWSGGATEESWVQQWSFYILPGIRHVVEQYLDAFLRRETRYFDRINVDQQITAYGFDANVGCMQGGSYRGFYYDSADLLVMGVGRTSREGSSWVSTFDHYPSDFCKVELDPVELLR
ncbi:hypothetical protein [Aliidiomarina celeris]|uniref:hypothetical protein n=1 Tax=Aliidiomarina celeris TaxID=2249428 RepID=UPI000DEB40E8|nr:hypothetical protein [Aliidiomarina celeris]